MEGIRPSLLVALLGRRGRGIALISLVSVAVSGADYHYKGHPTPFDRNACLQAVRSSIRSAVRDVSPAAGRRLEITLSKNQDFIDITKEPLKENKTFAMVNLPSFKKFNEAVFGNPDAVDAFEKDFFKVLAQEATDIPISHQYVDPYGGVQVVVAKSDYAKFEAAFNRANARFAKELPYTQHWPSIVKAIKEKHLPSDLSSLHKIASDSTYDIAYWKSRIARDRPGDVTLSEIVGMKGRVERDREDLFHRFQSIRGFVSRDGGLDKAVAGIIRTNQNNSPNPTKAILEELNRKYGTHHSFTEEDVLKLRAYYNDIDRFSKGLLRSLEESHSWEGVDQAAITMDLSKVGIMNWKALEEAMIEMTRDPAHGKLLGMARELGKRKREALEQHRPLSAEDNKLEQQIETLAPDFLKSLAKRIDNKTSKNTLSIEVRFTYARMAAERIGLKITKMFRKGDDVYIFFEGPSRSPQQLKKFLTHYSTFVGEGNMDRFAQIDFSNVDKKNYSAADFEARGLEKIIREEWKRLPQLGHASQAAAEFPMMVNYRVVPQGDSNAQLIVPGGWVPDSAASRMTIPFQNALKSQTNYQNKSIKAGAIY